MRAFWLACLCIVGCASSTPPTGVAFVRVSTIYGPCDLPIDPLEHQPRIPNDLPFKRFHATAAVTAASRWSGGNLVVAGWQGSDGTIGRLYADISPSRAFGVTAFNSLWTTPGGALPPGPAPVALGFVTWRNGVRTFAAHKALGVVNYQPLPTKDDGILDDHTPGDHGKTLYVVLALEGVDEVGATQCRIVGLHADVTHERVDKYDPKWFQANPTALIVDDKGFTAPTFAQDVTPTASLVSADAAGPDPGGEAPKLGTADHTWHSGFNFGSGDGSGGCD